ncbi:MAG: DegQ family serine endoprotease [Gammaproteobacteria bacterium]
MSSHHDLSQTSAPRPIVAPSVTIAFALIAWTLFVVHGAAAATLPDFENLVESYSPTVVNIQSRGLADQAPVNANPNQQVPEFLQRFFQFEGPMQRGPSPYGQAPGRKRSDSIGSGVIVSADGYILTNAHVVREAGEIIVRMHDRKEFVAELVGSDNHSDIAVLKISAAGLPHANLGNSDEVRVGQWVLAIGAPFGLEQTATQGIVSAVSRSLPNDTYVPFIQTDVALNPGNSGGPLFNLDGDVIGINSQIFSRTGGYMGLSFAIPINLAQSVAEQLKTTGTIQRGWLGIGIQELDGDLAKSFKLDQPTGALIRNVEPNSPAAAAKLQSGDVILSYGDKPVNRSSDLPPLVAGTKIGDQVPIKILRNGKERQLKVTIGTLRAPGEPLANAAAPEPLGITVTDLDEQQRRTQGLDSGVVVAKVTPGKPAAVAGLNPNDIILSYDNQTVESAEQLLNLAKQSKPGTIVPILVQRNDSTRFLALEFPPA